MKRTLTLFSLFTFAIILCSCDSNELIVKQEFYINGNIKTNYFEDDKGKKQGEYKLYFENGKLNEIRTYKDDKLCGSYLVYYENGRISHRASFLNNIQIDTAFFYAKNGNLEGLSILDENSKIIKEVAFDALSGNKILVKTYLVGTGEITSYKEYKNGIVINGYMKSKYANFKEISADSIAIQLFGLEFDNHDSIVTNYVKNFNFTSYDDAKVIERIKSKDVKNTLNIELKKEYYVKGKASIYIELFKTIKNNVISIQVYKIQFDNNDKIANNSLYPIYVND